MLARDLWEPSGFIVLIADRLSDDTGGRGVTDPSMTWFEKELLDEYA